jgi:hypothetical protein
MDFRFEDERAFLETSNQAEAELNAIIGQARTDPDAPGGVLAIFTAWQLVAGRMPRTNLRRHRLQLVP